jgi:uncharacterized membrane protein HdeD (DUF308 family)
MISLTLSILLLLTQFPVLAINTIIVLLSISLLTVGAERVASGIMLIRSYSSLPESTIRLSSRSKKVTPYTNVSLGGVAILFAVIALVSPQFISEISLHLLSIAISVMFNGLARITQGALDASQPKWLRAFSIGIGALSIVASVFATNSKLFGIVFPIRILFVVLLIYGIGMIVYGATGKSSVEEILKKKFNKISDK